MTNAELVSLIFNSSKNLNKDEHTSRRYVLSVARAYAKTLISQKLLDRTILKELNLYTTLKCVEFIEDDVVRCPLIDFRRCEVLMKSKKPIPEPIFSRLGTSIVNVESIDGLVDLKEIDSKTYKRNKLRRFKLKDKIYIYLGPDNHLYIPDHKVYSINLDVITLKNDENECSECDKDDCKSGWSYSFICPDKLITTVIELAQQHIFGVKQVYEDENPNGVKGD
jgi:hypothetical protein